MAITEFDGQGGHSYDGIAVEVRNVASDPLAMCAGGKRLCQGILASNADCCALCAYSFGVFTDDTVVLITQCVGG